MPKKQTMTMAELKSLLIAGFSAEQNKQVKLQARLQQEPGNEAHNEKPEAIVIKNMFAEWISDVLARRLKQNRRSTPLLSSRDVARFIRVMINEIAKVKGEEFDAKSRKVLEKLMMVMSRNVLKMMRAIVQPRKNPYEEYWQWAMTALNLTAERGILPAELLALEGATDEITRRMFTKKQFIALSKRAANTFMGADVLKQKPEAELMPQLRETIKKSRAVINAWLGEEVERIYATA